VAWKMELAMAGVLLAVPDVVSFSGGTWRRQHAHSGGQQFRLHTKTPGQARGRPGAGYPAAAGLQALAGHVPPRRGSHRNRRDVRERSREALTAKRPFGTTDSWHPPSFSRLHPLIPTGRSDDCSLAGR
jgi:hypothetical protein